MNNMSLILGLMNVIMKNQKSQLTTSEILLKYTITPVTGVTLMWLVALCVLQVEIGLLRIV